jgi:hypothetical protein
MSNAARVPDLPGIVASVSDRCSPGPSVSSSLQVRAWPFQGLRRAPQFRRAQELGGLPFRLSPVAPSSPHKIVHVRDYMDGLGVAHATGRLPAVVRAPG